MEGRRSGTVGNVHGVRERMLAAVDRVICGREIASQKWRETVKTGQFRANRRLCEWKA